MTDQVEMLGVVTDPTSVALSAGTEVIPGLGRQRQQLVSDIHGKWFEACKRGVVFGANVTAVTVPQIASGLVSVFSLWNPPTSGIDMELIDMDFGQVLATTVVDAVGLYYSSDALARAGTFTTIGTPQSMYVGGGASPKGKFYSAYTHSGTPTRIGIPASFGAVTDAGLALPHYVFDGSVIIPPGTVVSVAMSTAAGVSSGLDISARWAEWLV